MFQSPENSVSHDDAHPCEPIAETFSSEPSAPPAVSEALPVDFSLAPTSTSPCCTTTECTPAPAPAAVCSAQTSPYIQIKPPISDVPVQTSTPNLPTPQQYVTLQPTFLQPESTAPTPQPAPALTTTAPSTTVDQPVPLANNPIPSSGPAVGPPQASITIAPTIAPTQNLLQPSLVMSDQNLQWILSSAANSQQNPEQAQQQGGPKVEKVFFTTAIPVGANAGSSVQQIGLSLPVIIIKQEESCQCQCACRDSAKDKSVKNVSPAPAPAPQPPAECPPAEPPQPPLSSPCCLPPSASDTAGAASSAPAEVSTSATSAESLANMDVSDYLSLHSPETAANLEALLLVAHEMNMSADGNP